MDRWFSRTLSRQIPYYQLIYAKAHAPTCPKSPLHPYTLGVVLCRHSVVVDCVCSEPLRQNDGDYLTQGGGDVPVHKVGVGWVRTIVNGAGVSWSGK